MVFAGCSFTFGHGLWYYSGLDNVPNGDDYLNIHQNKTAYVKNMESLRFSKLVSNHFNKFDIVRTYTAGCEEDSLKFLEILFSDDENISRFSHITKDRLDYNEVEYIIFQTSYADRNTLFVEVDGKKMELRMKIDNEKIIYDTLSKIGIDSYDKFCKFMGNQLYDKIKSTFEFYESKGIKCRILSITNDYIDFIKQDQWMLDRFIPMKYNGKTYDYINEMARENPYLLIKNDHETFGENTPHDLHPSKLCHEIIAKNIIEKLESENFK